MQQPGIHLKIIKAGKFYHPILFRGTPKFTGLLFHKRAFGFNCGLVVHKLLQNTINSLDNGSDQRFASNISIKRTVVLYQPSFGRKHVNQNCTLKIQQQKSSRKCHNSICYTPMTANEGQLKSGRSAALGRLQKHLCEDALESLTLEENRPVLHWLPAPLVS